MAVTMCPHCFASQYDGFCEKCGYTDRPTDPEALPLFASLCGKYIIGAPLGVGGFGITYSAKSTIGDRHLAIKEYYPRGIVQREASGSVRVIDGYRQAFRHGLERFSQEASTLRGFSSVPGVVQVDDYLEENGTGYIVMEYLSGRTLKKDTTCFDGVYPFQRALSVFLQVASALVHVHNAGLLHRDISPDNIMVDDAGTARLIDFGAVRSYMLQQSFTVVMKQGYAPIEQYSTSAPQGCYTDIYALGCTMYAVLTGCRMPDAPSRLEGAPTTPLSELRFDLPSEFVGAIERATAVLPQNRFQTMQEFIFAATATTAPAGIPPDNHASKRKRHRVPISHKPKSPICCSLRVVSGNCAGMTMPFQPDIDYMIGRSPGDSQLQIPLETISKSHFGIRYQTNKSRFVIFDNNSTNGTFFSDGQRLIANCAYAAFSGDCFYLADQNCLIELTAE